MRKLESRSGQMVRWNPKKGGRYVQTATFGLSKEAEDRVGKIYGLMTLEGSPRAGEALFAHIEDALGRGVLEALRKSEPETSATEVFEMTIACVNRALARLLGDNGIGLDPVYVSAALVAVHGSDMAAAIWGRPTLLLYRLNSTGSSRAFDIADDGRSYVPTGSCFGSVIAGPLGNLDRLLVASEDPREFIAEGRLEQIMAMNDPSAAAGVIREELSGTIDGPPIAVLTLDVAPVRYLEDVSARQPVSTASSLAQLHGLESRTGEIMSPSAMSALQKTLVQTATAAGGKLSLLGKKPPAANRLAEQTTQPLSATRRPNSGLREFASKIFGALKTFGVATLSFGRIVYSGRLKEVSDTAANKAVDSLNSLPAARKKILFAVLMAVFTFNSSVLGLSWKNRLNEFASANERLVVSIGQKIDSAEVSMLYRDETRARATMAEAEAEIARLPERSEQDRATKAALTVRVATSRDSMRHAIKLEAPTEVSNDTDAVKELEKLAAAKSGALNPKAADSAVWNGRVYELLPAENRIVRHAANAPATATPQFYLKDATDVSKGISMTIDGDVWVLSSDGDIARLLRGSRVDFQAATVEPALTDAKRIRTSPDSKFLHVLSEGRLVRFDKKTGALVAQFESDELKGATDFTVAADGKSALVTAGSRSLRFSLPE